MTEAGGTDRAPADRAIPPDRSEYPNDFNRETALLSMPPSLIRHQ
ncbi:hypothetical protein AHFPHNDE_03152 [Pseudomonas sp. MM227]|nr:hypothetical protein AHFPHNDE_03152 [Pseudomonas sp. MM227]